MSWNDIWVLSLLNSKQWWGTRSQDNFLGEEGARVLWANNFICPFLLGYVWLPAGNKGEEKSLPAWKERAYVQSRKIFDCLKVEVPIRKKINIAWERSLPTYFKRPDCFQKKNSPARIQLPGFSAMCWKAKRWSKVYTHYFCCYNRVKTRPSINFCTIASLVFKSTVLCSLLSKQSWKVRVLWKVLIFSSFLYGFKKGTESRSYSSLTRHNMKFSCAFEVIPLHIID